MIAPRLLLLLAASATRLAAHGMKLTVPVVPVAGRVYLPTEKVHLLSIGARQTEPIEVVQISDHRLFAVQASAARGVGIIDSEAAEAPQVGDTLLLCELLSCRAGRGYADSITASLSTTSLALSRVRVDAVEGGPCCPHTPAGLKQSFFTVEASLLSDEKAGAAAPAPVDFEHGATAQEAFEAAARSMHGEVRERDLERALWSCILDTRRLIDELYHKDPPLAKPRARGAPARGRRRRADRLIEDPFEAIRAFAPRNRAAASVASGGGSAAALRASRSRSLLERSLRGSSAAGLQALGRRELFSFAVAASLSEDEIQQQGVASSLELLYSRSTAERLEVALACVSSGRKWLAARAALKRAFGDA